MIGSLAVAGIYESAQAATAAIQGGQMPEAFYCIVTPSMNAYMQSTRKTVVMTEFK